MHGILTNFNYQSKSPDDYERSSHGRRASEPAIVSTAYKALPKKQSKNPNSRSVHTSPINKLIQYEDISSHHHHHNNKINQQNDHSSMHSYQQYPYPPPDNDYSQSITHTFTHTRTHTRTHTKNKNTNNKHNKKRMRNNKHNKRRTRTPTSKYSASRNRNRSHSFSISSAYSTHTHTQTHHKKHTSRLPLHYSPSISPLPPQTPVSPLITPPPPNTVPNLSLPPALSLNETTTTPTHHHSPNLAHNRPRSHSFSYSLSKSKGGYSLFGPRTPSRVKNMKHHQQLNCNDRNNSNRRIDSSKDSREESSNSNKSNKRRHKNHNGIETIEINNLKSLLITSWFSAPSTPTSNSSFNNNSNNKRNKTKTGQYNDEIGKNKFILNEDSEIEDDVLYHLDDTDIDNVLDHVNNTNDETDGEDDKSISKWKDDHIEDSFTTKLKGGDGHRKKRRIKEQSYKNEAMSFRDFIAQENRKALQEERMDMLQGMKRKNNKKPTKVRKKQRPQQFKERIVITKGKTMKIDYGMPDGSFTMYKFDIVYNRGKNMSASHWCVRKRYSDFFKLNTTLQTELSKQQHHSNSHNHNGKAVKLPKLPPKTFKKNFSESFVAQRHNGLLSYLNGLCNIHSLSTSVTLLTFLGAVNNHTLPYNNKYLESRMSLSVYVSNYADTGDVLLFETKSYIAASLRSVTSSNYDHVAIVYRDIHHKQRKNGQKKMVQVNLDDAVSVDGLYLVESTCDGVKSYPLKKRLKQWSVLCPQICVRRLQLLKRNRNDHNNTGSEARNRKHGIGNIEHSSSLSALNDHDFVSGKHGSNGDNDSDGGGKGYTKYDYINKDEAFYLKAKEFKDKVIGLEYAIWTNVFRLNDIPFEKQKSYFCSQLVSAFFKYMSYLPENVKTNHILPGHYADDESNRGKLPLCDCILMPETLIMFTLPAVSAARNRF